MRLLGMEIQGFKSFPDKTRLDFNDGLTAVVGPNGSGKSNIADALRWVLGEQSSRSLRGNRMEDVIFGGTQSRKPLASCSVTLFLDNKDRNLPYNEDEVAITRKYFRSGESEFRINKTAVRLMDIHEIFMDTGLGRDGYSIIGQGKIAEIVSAKSSERREIFEEAAGISKFRYRKKEAERRLDSAEENLLRLKDILLELEGRIEPLKRDSEKAERFLKLSAEKRGWEISIWSHQLTQIKERLKKLSDEVFLEDKRYKEAQDSVTQLENAVTSLYDGIQQTVVDMDTMQKEILRDQETLSGSASTKAVLENDIQHNNRSLSEIEDQLRLGYDGEEELRVKEKGLRELQEDQKNTVAIAEESLKGYQQRYFALQQQSADIDGKGQGFRIRRSEIYRLLDEKRAAFASGRAIVEETTAQLSSFEQTLANSKNNIAEITAEQQEITDLIHELDQHLGRLLQDLDAHKQQLHALEEHKRGLDLDRQKLLHEASGARQKARLLEDMDKNMEGYAGSVRFVMSSAQKGMLQGIVAPVSSIIKVDKRYSVAIEVALGAALQNIITENEESAKAAIRLLASKNSGRATFLPLSAVKGTVIRPTELLGKDGYIGVATELVEHEGRFTGVVASLLGRTVVAQNLDKGVSLAKACGYRYRIVTLDGQILNTGGSMTGGSMARSAGLLGRTAQIEELTKQALGAEGEAEKLAGRITLGNEKIEEASKAILELSAEMRTLEDEKIGYLAESKRIALSLRQAEEFAVSSSSQYQDILSRLESNRALSGQFDTDIRSLEQELRSIEEEITGGNFLRDQILAEKNELDGLIAKSRTEIALLQRDITGNHEKLQELMRESQSRKDKRAHLEGEKKRLVEENENLVLRIENLGEEKKRLQKRIEDAGNEILHKSEIRNQLEQELNQKRQLQRQTEVTRDNSYRTLVERQSRLEAVENEQKALVNNLWESYELTIGQALEEAKPIEELPLAMRTLSELRNRIKALGNVNLGAIEEFQEVLNRYEELSKQITDIESAKKELLELITQLTQSMCVIFSEKFAAVDRSFREIFVELFGGGKASLSLTEPDNVLESGIEIHVQPPGKVIKNLTLLSGGEQSFVAIAIYFAILKVNPSPFCLLDEIEAALDDVNVAKFARYLKELTDTTQFLVITHRRGTMEEADRLYGVTMQEDGISKLLELKVEELSKSLGLKE